MIHIEDILHLIVDTIGPNTTDAEILKSISRQCKKGTPLTDRQFELIKTKIGSYKEQLTECNVDLTEEFIPRLPLRVIDRSKYITISSTPDGYLRKATEQETNWIKIRFPFSKKHIVCVEKLSIKYRKQYSHSKGTHEHYFRLQENIIYDVLTEFKDKQFEIDSQLLEFYNEIQEIKNNEINHIPMYTDKFYNVPEKVLTAIEDEIGEINNHNAIKLIDRKRRYGIKISNDTNNGLQYKIASRENSKIAINPNEYTLDQVAEAVLQLDRFPMLVVVDSNKELEQISTVYNVFNGIVSNSKQTVLFRIDNNNEKYNLNNYIHDKQLNNWLDESTEIVYIEKTSLPKLLLKSIWKPMSILLPTSMRANSTVGTYINDVCDLIMYYDKDTGLMIEKVYSNGYV
tara:strand:- start:622 stop:1821 length:1200 start_codon:yes stop_codon:yes gene_type:complete